MAILFCIVIAAMLPCGSESTREEKMKRFLSFETFMKQLAC